MIAMTMRWEQVGVAGETVPGRWGHSLSVASSGSVYLFGGFDGESNSPSNELHVYHTGERSWSKISVIGEPPAPRDSHSCTVVGGSKLFVFAGTDGASPLNDLHVFDTRSNSWTQPLTTGEAPKAREGHSAALYGLELYVFGGMGRGGELQLNDLYSLNTRTYEWREVITSGPSPCSRDSHSLSLYKNKLIVFGGQDASAVHLSDVHILDLDTRSWTPLETSGPAPSPRAGHAAGCIGGTLFVYGGYSGSSDNSRLHDDFFVLDILTGVWQKVSITGAGPSSRFSLATALVDAENGVLVFYGGCNRELEPVGEMFYLHTGIRSIRSSEDGASPGVDPGTQPVSSGEEKKADEEEVDEDDDESLYEEPEGDVELIPEPAFVATITEVFDHGSIFETTMNGVLYRGSLFNLGLTPCSRKKQKLLELEHQISNPKELENVEEAPMPVGINNR